MELEKKHGFDQAFASVQAVSLKFPNKLEICCRVQCTVWLATKWVDLGVGDDFART